MKIRFAYGRTASRPDFRELSEAPYDQVIGAGVVVGNPDLNRAVIDSVDARWEWYPTKDDNLSCALFYKKLYDPIEVVIRPGSNITTTYQNAPSAINLGLEIEFRKTFGFLDERLRDVYASGNVSFIYSDVDLSGDIGVATSSKRPLQGQSPYVVNLTIGYDNPDSKISGAILYNVFGRRIASIGYYEMPDVYEQPYHQLDIVGSWKIDSHWSAKMKIKNLIGGDVEYLQGGQVKESYAKGREFGLGVSWSR